MQTFILETQINKSGIIFFVIVGILGFIISLVASIHIKTLRLEDLLDEGITSKDPEYLNKIRELTENKTIEEIEELIYKSEKYKPQLETIYQEKLKTVKIKDLISGNVKIQPQTLEKNKKEIISKIKQMPDSEIEIYLLVKEGPIYYLLYEEYKRRYKQKIEKMSTFFVLSKLNEKDEYISQKDKEEIVIVVVREKVKILTDTQIEEEINHTKNNLYRKILQEEKDKRLEKYKEWY